MEQTVEKTKKELARLQLEIIENIRNLAVTAFGLVAAFAWNTAIQKLFDYIFPDKQNGLKAMFLYAVMVTLLVVLVTYYLSKLAERFKKKLEILAGLEDEKKCKKK